MGDPYLLLIEENPDDVYLTLRELRRFDGDTEVQVITDSATALEHLLETEELPSALLLGLKFIHLSGLELLAELRANPRTRHLPVVMLTAGREERERVSREVKYAEPVACLDKPLDFAAFSSVLRNLGVPSTAVVV